MGEAMTLEQALAYLKPAETNNGTISLQAQKAREAVKVIASEIAALQSRAFEDGARWMRLKAACVAATPSLGNVPTAQQADGRKSAAAAILALPLKSEGERSDA